MFRLGGQNFPQSLEELAQAMVAGLKEVLVPAPGRPSIVFDGEALPHVDRLRVDVSGAVLKPGPPPAPPIGTGPAEPALTASRFEVEGQSLRAQGCPFDLSVTAADVGFNFDRDAAGRPLLTLRTARDGRLEAKILRVNLDALILAAAKAGAAAQGVTVTHAQLALTPIDSRSLALEVKITAKKLFMTAVIRVKGRVSIDPAMTVRLSGLACEGEGAMGSMACGFIRPQLAKVENKPFPLAALALGQVRLNDLQVHVGNEVAVVALFGV